MRVEERLGQPARRHERRPAHRARPARERGHHGRPLRVPGPQPRHVPARPGPGIRIQHPERQHRQAPVPQRTALPRAVPRRGSGYHPSSSRNKITSPEAAATPAFRPPATPTFSASRTTVTPAGASTSAPFPTTITSRSTSRCASALPIARSSSAGRSPIVKITQESFTSRHHPEAVRWLRWREGQPRAGAVGNERPRHAVAEAERGAAVARAAESEAAQAAGPRAGGPQA